MEIPSMIILKKLQEIEAEMRRINYWKKDYSDFDLSECKEAFCADKLIFEEWLQYVFIPNAKNAVKISILPKNSMVGVKAIREYNYMSIVDEALPLTKLLSEFDKIVNELAKEKSIDNILRK